jgi:N-acyl homoserine lactone hydrolase
MNGPAPITITPVFVADLHVEGERMPIYVHVIDHPDARVLVDTGMTEYHPALADMDPRLRPLSEQDLDLAAVDIVVNTHLHGDHCGGNHHARAAGLRCAARRARRTPGGSIHSRML